MLASRPRHRLQHEHQREDSRSGTCWAQISAPTKTPGIISGTTASCTQAAQFLAGPGTISLYFIVIQSGSVISSGGNFSIYAKLSGPGAPAISTITSSSSIITVNFTAASDTTTNGFIVYCDPLPGQENPALQVDAGLVKEEGGVPACSANPFGYVLDASAVDAGIEDADDPTETPSIIDPIVRVRVDQLGFGDGASDQRCERRIRVIQHRDCGDGHVRDPGAVVGLGMRPPHPPRGRLAVVQEPRRLEQRRSQCSLHADGVGVPAGLGGLGIVTIAAAIAVARRKGKS